MIFPRRNTTEPPAADRATGSEPTTQAQAEGQAEPEPRPVVREAAQRAAAGGHHDQAVLLFRQAISEDHDVDRAYLEYARYLADRNNSAAAEEVLAGALTTNGANVDALELYLEVHRKRELDASHRTWAFARLQEDMESRPESHRGALYYVIASRLDRGDQILAASSDPVCRAAIAVNTGYAERTIDDDAVSRISSDAGLPQHEADRAHAIVLLGRGNKSAAVALLKSMDANAIPMNSLRRAIRRALATDKRKQAAAFLEIYREQRPHV